MWRVFLKVSAHTGEVVSASGMVIQAGAELCFALLFVITSQSNGEPIAGPFRIIPNHVESCPPELVQMPFEITVRGLRDRHNHDLWFYSANVTTAFTMSDKFSAHVFMASWSSRGGWKDNAQVFKFKKACSTIKAYLPKMWGKVMAATFGNQDADCPFPPGSYSAINISSDLSIALVPAFFYGKWRMDSQLVETATEKCGGCIRVYAQIVPK